MVEHRRGQKGAKQATRGTFHGTGLGLPAKLAPKKPDQVALKNLALSIITH